MGWPYMRTTNGYEESWNRDRGRHQEARIDLNKMGGQYKDSGGQTADEIRKEQTKMETIERDMHPRVDGQRLAKKKR